MKIFKKSFTLALLFLSFSLFAEENFVKNIVGEIIANVEKIKSHSPNSVPMAFWDFDGTIICGDISLGHTVNGKKEYVGMFLKGVEGGYSSVFKDVASAERYLEKDYPYLEETVGKFLAWPSLGQVFFGADALKLESYCRDYAKANLEKWYFSSSLKIMRALEKAGVENYIVSGSPDVFVKAAGVVAGVPRERCVGIRQRIAGGRFSTQLEYPLSMNEGKVECVREILNSRSGAVAVAGFGNSYWTDGPFMRYIAVNPLPLGVKGVSVMINGGKVPEGYEGLFRLVNFEKTNALSGPASFSISCDSKNALKRCGEDTVFTITAFDKNKKRSTNGVYKVYLNNFSENQIYTGEVDLAKNNPFKIKGKLDAPGFLRVSAYSDETKAVKHFSVGYEPEKIVKASPSPADFDSFWAEARAKFRKEVAFEVKMERDKKLSTPKYDFFRVSFPTYARRIYAFLTVPTAKTKKPYPVRVGVNAAGFGDWTNSIDARTNAICVQFAVYDWQMDSDWKKLKWKYEALDKEMHERYGARYCAAGITEGRESYYFYPVILGIDRAIDWIGESYNVDKSKFVYHGTSQGGGFGFYLCGLNHRFTKAVFYVPAITDTMGYLAGRQSGWPYIIESNSSTEQKRAAAEKWAPYFDGANFASRIKCPVRVAVGFSDVVCPPCAVYAAYNEIKVKDKAIGHGIGMTHSCFPSFYTQYGKWLDAE
jgi:cephalosporin-C deacetylase-like acetyl esterase